MISLKRFLDGEELIADSPHARALSLITEALAVHAIQYDRPERDQFQGRVRRMAAALETCTDRSEAARLAGELNRALETYHRLVEQSFSTHSRELRALAGMLTQSLLRISKTSEGSASELRRIGKQIESASQVDDLKTLRGMLGQSLESLCSEAFRQEAAAREIEQHAQQANGQAAMTGTPSALGAGNDPTTGLPGPRALDEMLRTKSADELGHYVAAMRLERLDSINYRFGFSAGDQMMVLFSQHIGQNMRGRDQLLRWHGPCFLALLDRQVPIEKVRVEVARIAATCRELTIQLGPRSVSLAVSLRWSVYPADYSRPTELIREINQFSCGAS